MSAADRAALDRSTFDAWPAACLALFDGEGLDGKLSLTAALAIVDREVEPADVRTTLLSVGELYAPDARSLYLALWPRSRGAQLLVRERAAVLSFVADGAFYQARLRVEPAGATGDRPADDGTGVAGLACFRATLASVDAQRVGYARLTSGITFELDEKRDAVVARWARQIEQIRLIAAAAPR